MHSKYSLYDLKTWTTQGKFEFHTGQVWVSFQFLRSLLTVLQSLLSCQNGKIPELIFPFMCSKKCCRASMPVRISILQFNCRCIRGGLSSGVIVSWFLSILGTILVVHGRILFLLVVLYVCVWFSDAVITFFMYIIRRYIMNTIHQWV